MRENIIPFCVWKWKIICKSYISFANRLHCNQYFHMIWSVWYWTTFQFQTNFNLLVDIKTITGSI